MYVKHILYIMCTEIKTTFLNCFVSSVACLLSVPGGLFGHALLRTDVTFAEKRSDIQLRGSRTRRRLCRKWQLMRCLL